MSSFVPGTLESLRLDDLLASRPSRTASTARMIAARIGPYEIVAKLGAGHMGEVYRAADLDTTLAIGLSGQINERKHL